MDKKKILQHLDHTLLKQDATWEQIKTLCDEGMQYHVASVCIPPCYVKEARDFVTNCLKAAMLKFVQLLVSLWEHRPLQLRLLKPRMLFPMGRMKLIW